ncbi:hypothetical protein THASP1DRAFT_22517, partial [Thamnocephalis sphaerospora]
DAVLADRMLSIPSQQVLLAEHRCAELFSEAEAAFKQSIFVVSTHINDGKVVDGFSTLMEKARNEAIALDEELFILFRVQLKNLATDFAEQFDTDMEPLCANSAELFMAKADNLRSKNLQNFKETVEDMLVGGTNWTFSEELKHLSTRKGNEKKWKR